MNQFFQTQMGHRFYNHDVPNIAQSLEKLATEQAKANELKERELLLKERELKLKEEELNLRSQSISLNRVDMP